MWRRHDTFDSYPTMMLLWQENEENTTSKYLPKYQTNNIRTNNYRSKRFSLKIHFFDIFTYNIYIDTYCKYIFNNFHSIKKKSFQSCDDIKIHKKNNIIIKIISLAYTKNTTIFIFYLHTVNNTTIDQNFTEKLPKSPSASNQLLPPKLAKPLKSHAPRGHQSWLETNSTYIRIYIHTNKQATPSTYL